MLKIRRSHDRLIFTMGITIPGKNGLYNETGPGNAANYLHFCYEFPQIESIAGEHCI